MAAEIRRHVRNEGWMMTKRMTEHPLGWALFHAAEGRAYDLDGKHADLMGRLDDRQRKVLREGLAECKRIRSTGDFGGARRKADEVWGQLRDMLPVGLLSATVDGTDGEDDPTAGMSPAQLVDYTERGGRKGERIRQLVEKLPRTRG